MKVIPQIKTLIKAEKNNKSIYFLLLIYTYICGSYITIAKDAGLSLAEYVLLLLSNHYYIIYGICIYTLYWTFTTVQATNNLEIIRYRKYGNYYLARMISAFIKIIILIALHIIIAAIVGGVNLGFGNQYLGHLIENYYSETMEVLMKFKDYFQTPVEAIVAVTCFLVVGLFFLYEIIFYVHEIFGIRTTICSVILILADILIGFKFQFDESIYEIFFLNNYIVLHHPLFLVGVFSVFTNITITVAASVILYITAIGSKRGKTIGQNSKDGYLAHSFSYAWFISAILGFIMLQLKVIPALTSGQSAKDCAFAIFEGFFKNGINIVQYLYYLAFYIFPIFAIDIFYEREKNNKITLAKFRYHSEKKWQNSVKITSLKFLIKYCVCFLLPQVIYLLSVKLFVKKSSKDFILSIFEYYDVNIDHLTEILIISIIFHLLELIVLYSLNAILVENIKNTTVSFLATFFGYFALLFTQGKRYNSLLFCGNAAADQIIGLYSKVGKERMILFYLMVYMVSQLVIYAVSIILRSVFHGKSN